MYEAICNHLRYATNKGNIRSAITVFRARTEKNRDFRVWNPQIITYACYKLDDNRIIGDPSNAEFTEVNLIYFKNLKAMYLISIS
jgi:nitric-oxide synthase, brain